MEILTALAIAPFLAALAIGAREAETNEHNEIKQQSNSVE